MRKRSVSGGRRREEQSVPSGRRIAVAVASYACTQPTAASLRPSLEVPTQGLSVTRFKDAEGEPVNAKHQCGYCENRVHCYCDKCFPDGE